MFALSKLCYVLFKTNRVYKITVLVIYFILIEILMHVNRGGGVLTTVTSNNWGVFN